MTARAKAPEADWRPASEAARREAAAEPAAPDDAAELNDLLFTRDELMNRFACHSHASLSDTAKAVGKVADQVSCL